MVIGQKTENCSCIFSIQAIHGLISRGHSSYTTKVINGREVVSEGPNIDDKEETDSLRAMQPSRDSPYLATESLTSFEP